MKITVKNARLAFPQLWKAVRINNEGEPAFSASFIIPKDHPQIPEIRAIFEKLAKEEWKDKAPAILKQLEAQDRLALHDGATKAQYQGYEGNMFISSRSKMRPTVFGRNPKDGPVSEESGLVYSGCYVNASLEFWAQDSKSYGKRINAQLRGVQFVLDGDAFAAGAPASEEDFDDLGDQGDDTNPLA